MEELDDKSVLEIDEKTIKELHNDNTIDGIIKFKELEEKAIDEYFNYLWKIYHDSVNDRKEVIKLLKQAKVHVKLMAFLVSFTSRGDIYEELNKLIDYIKDNLESVKKEKDLIELINIALEKLQYNRVIEGNDRIFEILNLLDSKNDIIYNSSIESIGNLATRINNISITTKDMSSDVAKIDTEIDLHLLSLGLKKS